MTNLATQSLLHCYTLSTHSKDIFLTSEFLPMVTQFPIPRRHALLLSSFLLFALLFFRRYPSQLFRLPQVPHLHVLSRNHTSCSNFICFNLTPCQQSVPLIHILTTPPPNIFYGEYPGINIKFCIVNTRGLLSFYVTSTYISIAMIVTSYLSSCNTSKISTNVHF